MLRVCTLFSLLALSNAAQFRNSVIFTSQEVPQSSAQVVPGLFLGTSYRIFGTYASGYDAQYASKVIISDNWGYSFTLATLAQAKPGSNYILDETRILVAPITVWDQNPAGTPRVPFTLYMVDKFITQFPVASAQLATASIDSQYGFWSAGVTVLSAEKYFTMSNFDLGSFPNMYISTVGFDEINSDYRVMYIGSQSEARISFLTVYGPIASLYNNNIGSSRFQFNFLKNTPYNYQLAPGASFAFLSPGYLSQGASYIIPYTSVPEAFDRSYTFGDSNWMHADIQARDVSPATIQLRFTSSGGDNRDVVSTADEYQNYGEAYGNRISFNVNLNGGTTPRFLYKITSSSALSFSLFGMLLVALFNKFY